MKCSSIFHVLLLTMITAVWSHVQAESVAFLPESDPNGSATLIESTRDHGYEFTVNVPITVTAVGVFDEGSDGWFMGNGPFSQVRATFWSKVSEQSGSLLRTYTVSDIDDPLEGPTIEGSGFSGQFRYRDLTAFGGEFVLDPGTYVISVRDNSGTGGGRFNILQGAASAVVGGPEVSFGVARRDVNFSGMAFFPEVTDPGANFGYFGPTFKYQVGVIPEPSSFALIGTLGVAFMLRRRRCLG